jgi:hypothetical protein
MVMFELCLLRLNASEQTYLKTTCVCSPASSPLYGIDHESGLDRNNGKKTLGIFPDTLEVEQCVADQLCWISDTQ